MIHSLLYALLVTSPVIVTLAFSAVSSLFQVGASPRMYMSHASICVGKERASYPYCHSQRWAICQSIRWQGMHHSRAPVHPIRSTRSTVPLRNDRSARRAAWERMRQTRPTPRTGQSCDRASLSAMMKSGRKSAIAHCTCAPYWFRGWERDWPHHFSPSW